MKHDARFLAVKILDTFEKEHSQLSLIRDKVFSRNHSDLSNKYRATVLTNEIVRLQDRFELMIEHVSGRKKKQLDPSLSSIIKIGFFEILYDEFIPDYASVDSSVKLTRRILNHNASGFTNAVLRKLIRKQESNPDWFNLLKKDIRWTSLPAWIQSRWRSQFGQKGFLELSDWMNKMPATYIRVNLNRKTLETVMSELIRSGIETVIYSDIFLKVKSGAGRILSTNLFQNGTISIQNPASAAVVGILEPKVGEKILDVCAAPGAKTLYLAEKVGKLGKIIASDFDEKRVSLGERDLSRHGLRNIQWEVKDAEKDTYEMADKILLDAPCTGTGVLGRKPDIRWRRKPSDIRRMSNLQLKILENISKFLKIGGTIVYSTCSLEPEENWEVVKRFLKLNDDFQLDKKGILGINLDWINDDGCLEIFPHIHGVDGMFAARLLRK
tara:strand:- start:565 stop:1884 length:1320 start_codon:yes stop_codon:yes gene_type:complete